MELSDYDKYQLSKYYPTAYSPKCVYTPSGEMGGSVSTKNGFAISQATTVNSTTLIDIGTTYDYTVFMY